MQLLRKRLARTNSHWTCCPQMRPRSAYRQCTGGIYHVAVTCSKAGRGTDQHHTLVRWRRRHNIIMRGKAKGWCSISAAL